jgi:hypothetical protein
MFLGCAMYKSMDFGFSDQILVTQIVYPPSQCHLIWFIVIISYHGPISPLLEWIET